MIERENGTMELAPCRSCRYFVERSIDLEIGALEGVCEKGIIAKSFSVYGVASDAEGQLICASYKYQNNFY